MTPPSMSDKTIREIVRGLMILAAFIWVGIFIIKFRNCEVDASIIVAAVSITSGLVGLISLRHGVDNSTNIGGPVDSVAVDGVNKDTQDDTNIKASTTSSS